MDVKVPKTLKFTWEHFWVASSLLVAILAFWLEFNSPPSEITRTTELLIEIFKLSASLIFAWNTQKIASRLEYIKNLRDRGIGAFRRINDIQSSVLILEGELRRVNNADRSPNDQDLQMFQVVTKQIILTIKSSIADWIDIIGEDLRNKGNLEELQREETELRVLQSGEETPTRTRRLEEVRREIEKLKRSLPALLQAENFGLENEYPRGGRTSPTILKYFLSSIEKHSVIFLTVKVSGKENERIEKLRVGEKLGFYLDGAMGTLHLSVDDSEGNWLGEAINPFEEQGLYHKDFIESLYEALKYYGIGDSMIGGGPHGFWAEFYERSEGTVDQFVAKVPIKKETS